MTKYITALKTLTPCYSIYVDTAQEIPASESTNHLLAGTTLINQGGISFNSGTGFFTINEAGTYYIGYTLSFTADNAGRRNFTVFHSTNPSYSYAQNNIPNNGSSSVVATSGAAIIYCAKNSTINMAVYQDSLTTLNCPETSTGDQGFFTIIKLG